MADLKYTVIKNDEQYNEYCDKLEDLVSSGLESQQVIEEYELLQLLISDWDEKHKLGPELDPVELVKSLMDDHGLNQTELAKIVDYSKNYVSEILNYKKRIPPKMVRRLADHFKIQQSALNKPYRLEGERTDSNSNDKDPQTSNVSTVFDIKTGNRVSYEEDPNVHASSKEELEYSLAN